MTISILEQAAAAITTNDANGLYSVTQKLVLLVNKEMRGFPDSEKTYAKPLLIVAAALAKHDTGMGRLESDVSAAVNAACFAMHEVAPCGDSLRMASEIVLQNIDVLAAQNLDAAVEACRAVAYGVDAARRNGREPEWGASIKDRVETSWTKHINALAKRDVMAAANAAYKAAGIFEKAAKKWEGHIKKIAKRDLAAAINIASELSGDETVGGLAKEFLEQFSPTARRPRITSKVSETTAQAISAFTKQFG